MSTIDLADEREFNVDWPGWPLSGNPLGDEFDEAARIRMVLNGRRLLPYLKRYQAKLGTYLLEIGPFFNPLSMNPELRDSLLGKTSVLFLENDPHAVAWLEATHAADVMVLNMNESGFRDRLYGETLARTGTSGPVLDSILISQVLNYVDFRQLFRDLSPIMKPGALLFINNAIDYGIPKLFSGKRPRTNDELCAVAEDMGFLTVEKDMIPNLTRDGNGERLILILSRE